MKQIPGAEMLIVLQFYVPLVCMMGKVKLLETKNTQVSNEDSYQEQFNQLRKDKEKRDLKEPFASNDYYQEISKCCPAGLHMDDWYNCVKLMNVGQGMFAEELLEIGAKAKEKYVIVHDNAWEKCPMKQRNEFEVLHIPHDKNNTVYVFVDVEINYDLSSEEEINFDGFKEMKYSCLEVSRDISHHLSPPRSVLHHITEKMNGERLYN